MITVNPWKKFVALLPDGSRTIATVITDNTTTSIVELQSTDQILVRGGGIAAGSKVLIIDGEIRQTVPNLTHYNVDIF